METGIHQEDAEGSALGGFNAAPAAQAEADLMTCCSSPAWARLVQAARPFDGVAAAVRASDEAFAALTTADIDDAISGHPRIGERPHGEGRDAEFSRSEQAGVGDAGADVQERLRAGNVAYEQRFDRVFLIRAAGRSPEEMLAELTRRLENADEAEADEVREQLRQITALRLERLFA